MSGNTEQYHLFDTTSTPTTYFNNASAWCQLKEGPMP
uniref:Uncharacterized protein n=1 Tax=Moniliophthora roreri TaxID=221103 RepID=A0A0W0FG93_MONRR